MNRLALSFFLVLASLVPASSGDLATLTATLKQGGYVIVFRHVATDESQKDIYPFRFDDMKAQRQLSDKGREDARAIGASLKQLGIPLGEIYTSKLNRAVETGKLIAGKDVSAQGRTDRQRRRQRIENGEPRRRQRKDRPGDPPAGGFRAVNGGQQRARHAQDQHRRRVRQGLRRRQRRRSADLQGRRHGAACWSHA